MRYIFLMLMLTGMLFSAQQRQIILGSFSIESNALFYSIDVQKTVDSEYRLKEVMEKYSLKLEYKKVGDYNVVTIYPFDNYPSLFKTIDIVKHYYPKAYAIKYPAFASSLKTVEPTVKEEEVAVEEEYEEEVVDDAKEDLVESEDEEVLVQEPVVEQEEIKYEPQKPQAPVMMKMPEVEPMITTDDMYLLLGLLLAIIGFVIYKIKAKKKEEIEI